MFDSKRQSLDLIYDKLNNLILKNVDLQKERLLRIKRSFVISNPSFLYRDEKNKLYNIISKLELLNPLNVLSRGYSITYYNDKTLKSIKNVVTAEITSVENYDYLTYQNVHVDFNNISKRNISGSVTVLFYSENKLVGSENQLVSIKKGETEFEDFVPMFYSDERVNIDSIKLVQNNLRYN